MVNISCEAGSFIDTTGYIPSSCGANYTLFMGLVTQLLIANSDISEPSKRLGREGTLINDFSEYDFVVVGAGAVGPIVASRLSENAGWNVLLLEAGPEEPTTTEIPSFAVSAVGSSLDWKYKTQPQENACLNTGGVCSWPRGKMVGGTTAMQGMMYTRGHPSIYDSWAEAGNDGWGYKDFLQYLIKSEKNKDKDIVDSGYHGFDGLMPVQQFANHPLLSEVIVEAGMELGYRNGDVTGANQTGVTIALMMIEDSLRASSSRIYLRPNKNRDNLHVAINSHVTKVLINTTTNTAYGIQFLDSDNNLKTVLARKEVILSAGTIGSPQLLLLSGVGPSEDLESLGIEVKQDLPVGENLRNHVSVGIGFLINDTAYTELNLETLNQFLLNRTGPMAGTGLTQTTAFILSKYAENEVPDLQVFFDGFSATCSSTGLAQECTDGSVGNCGQRYIYSRPTNILPLSKGYLKLNSTDPLDYPLIYPNYLSEQRDIDILVEGIKTVINFTKTESMQIWGFVTDTTPTPGCENFEFETDEYFECSVRRATGPENHQAGTCKMGPEGDATAVVSPELKVHGIHNLRVADMSIMPYPVNSNPIATLVAIGEKAKVCSSNFATFMTLVGTLITNTPNITDPCNRLGQDGTLLKDLEEYDFIVIGAGAAGPVITSRLSENTNWEVLLLEAGPEEPSITEIPTYSIGAIGTAVDWQYSTQEQNTSCLSTGGICSWPRGKMIGGSMALQGMMYTRGNKVIYDDWADAGNDGWSYEEVLPYFIKAENNKAKDIDSDYHGFDGPLIINHFPYRPVISEDIVSAAEEIGYRNGDVSGKNQTGIAIALMTVDEGLRSSTPRMYLRPHKNRANLHVSINSHVTKILIHPNNHTAYAVQFLDSNNVTKTVYARKEIILSAGAIGSPHILLLSGVGPKEDLEKLDIEVLSDLPVGKNLHNHVSMGFGFTTNDTATEELTSETLSQFIINRTGPLASTGLTQTTLFMTSQYAEEDVPDLQVFLDGYSASCSRTGLEAECSDGTIGTCGRRYINARPTNVWPRSRGYLTLNTTNPLDYPLIYPNYLTEQLDVNVLIDGIKQIISLIETKALAKWDFQQDTTPVDGCEDIEFGSDNYWECVIRRETGPENHQGGTCKMGALNDITAVVDPQLKVIGIQNLRVVDASIFPFIPNANPTSSIIMAAEKSADLIKNKWLKNDLNTKKIFCYWKLV
uniref:Glucose-methanol-choline oxidoreductase N-terminal domain-containing protein n=2 Tax=Timema TaxID=61471 RepID=A0A7R9IAX6_9NEOP|nr:unnamed protein product [Timema bartmani]CAD7454021.1 unnamed protein product [Timema tahoe]